MAVNKSLASRITLDCILIAVFVTLFSKNVISLMYHEVVGLVLLGLFLIHVIFNRKWLGTIAAKMIAKRLTGRSGVIMVINALMGLSWVGVFVTGILVSKKLFPFELSFLNPWHFFISALALILTSIHFGLHWKYFWGFMGKHIPLPRVVAIVLCVALIGFGGYRIVTSSLGRWISAPFTPREERGGPPRDMEGAEGTSDSEPIRDKNAGQTDGNQTIQHNHGQQPFSLANLFNVVATWFSIMFTFAAMTRGVEYLFTRRKTAIV